MTLKTALNPISTILRPLQLDDARRATVTAHAYIRDLIFAGELPTGMVISQVEVANALGISRTPLREALRMLQEEGLIEAAHNQRCKIAGFRADELDSIYATRIMLDMLGMTIALPQLRRSELEAAEEALQIMETIESTATLAATGPTKEWKAAHRVFHNSFIGAAPATLRNQIAIQAERGERFVLLLANARPFGSFKKTVEHRGIMEFVRSGDISNAIIANARHLSSTALMLLADVASDYEPILIRTTLKLVMGELSNRVGNLTPPKLSEKVMKQRA